MDTGQSSSTRTPACSLPSTALSVDTASCDFPLAWSIPKTSSRKRWIRSWKNAKDVSESQMKSPYMAAPRQNTMPTYKISCKLPTNTTWYSTHRRHMWRPKPSISLDAYMMPMVSTQTLYLWHCFWVGQGSCHQWHHPQVLWSITTRDNPSWCITGRPWHSTPAEWQTHSLYQQGPHWNWMPIHEHWERDASCCLWSREIPHLCLWTVIHVRIRPQATWIHLQKEPSRHTCTATMNDVMPTGIWFHNLLLPGERNGHTRHALSLQSLPRPRPSTGYHYPSCPHHARPQRSLPTSLCEWPRNASSSQSHHHRVAWGHQGGPSSPLSLLATPRNPHHWVQSSPVRWSPHHSSCWKGENPPSTTSIPSRNNDVTVAHMWKFLLAWHQQGHWRSSLPVWNLHLVPEPKCCSTTHTCTHTILPMADVCHRYLHTKRNWPLGSRWLLLEDDLGPMPSTWPEQCQQGCLTAEGDIFRAWHPWSSSFWQWPTICECPVHQLLYILGHLTQNLKSALPIVQQICWGMCQVCQTCTPMSQV